MPCGNFLVGTECILQSSKKGFSAFLEANEGEFVVAIAKDGVLSFELFTQVLNFFREKFPFSVMSKFSTPEA